MPYKDIEDKRKQDKRYYKENMDKIRNRQSETYDSEDNKRRCKEWREKNKEYIKKYMNNYLKQRREEDPKFRLDQNMKNLIYYSLKGKKAGRRWESLVDYTLKDLMEHLESRFDENMTWENYGNYWHIDHIKPRSLFKYTFSEEPEFKECWSLKNLQPLEKTANLRKSNIFELESS